MQISACKSQSPVVRTAKSLPLTAAADRDSYTPSTPKENMAAEFWRDYGINPAAMARRAFLEKPLPMGAPLPQGVKAPKLWVDVVRSQVGKAIQSSDGLESLQANLKAVAESSGLKLELGGGAPTVNWDLKKAAVLDVKHGGGAGALHEMVHVVQCVIGGSAALGQAAAEKFQTLHGRPAQGAEEIRSCLARLSEVEKASAMKRVVKPMEEQAYSRFEETAFHTAGMSGKKSKDYAGYKQRLEQVAEAFAKGYERAEVPELATRADSKVYGGVAHLGRTHGETALLLAGAGAAYYGLTRMAMRIHPALGIPLACPLGYLLYRSMVSG